MTAPKCSEQEFIDLFKTLGAKRTAERLGTTERNVYTRRRNIEKRLGAMLTAPSNAAPDYPARATLDVENGVVLVGSDAHYWPGIVTTAHRAFVRACKEMKPVAVIMNGDMLDGASISRHPPIGWEDRPTVAQEIETCQERLGEIMFAAGKAHRFWPLGNHDARLSTRIATVAPELAKVAGVQLKDHFPDFAPCWSVWINDNVVVKHRGAGGLHATHNNTLKAGLSMVTGHLHSLKVTPWSDYTGTRYGVDTGTMAEPFGKPFENYMEDGPRNWRSGFAVLTFHKGRLLWPEVVHVMGDNEVEFRGKVWEV